MMKPSDRLNELRTSSAPVALSSVRERRDVGEHTPGPWSMEITTAGPFASPFVSITSRSGDLAYMTLRPNQVVANASLIVRAVNSHAAMIAALEQAEDYFDGRADVVDGSYGVPEPNAEMSLLSEIRDALAIARTGGQS